MGHLGTHVLDTMNGCAAAGMAVKLQRVAGDPVETLRAFTLNADGRNEGGAVLDAHAMAVGRYRLVFSVAPCFHAIGVQLPEPPFVDDVNVRLRHRRCCRPVPRAVAGQSVGLLDLQRLVTGPTPRSLHTPVSSGFAL